MSGESDLPDRDRRMEAALAAAMAEQKKYEQKRYSRLGRGAEKATAPIGGLLRRFVPPGLLRRALVVADRGAGWTLPVALHDTNDLAACDASALRVQGWAAGTGAASGGAAGWFGGLGMTLDIPATISLAARTVRATGQAYGFEGEGEEELVFRLMVLELATVRGLEGRKESLGKVNQLARELQSPEVRYVLEKGADWVVDKVVDRVARGLGTDLLKRKAAQVVPLAGAAIGAGVNASFQTDVARAARYGFRLRWLMHRQLLPAPEAAPEETE
ncbi:EcsC family protein [Vannielia litorea]|uniref:EcsC family protein n=1 Tax=Vannielia litorea TaxID=1217970 RepID=UPI001C950197|nr:EcsC family protein [Vannielia litorea]MBY6153159.1 EcsC family protein [Vannielia litorea]